MRTSKRSERAGEAVGGMVVVDGAAARDGWQSFRLLTLLCA